MRRGKGRGKGERVTLTIWTTRFPQPCAGLCGGLKGEKQLAWRWIRSGSNHRATPAHGARAAGISFGACRRGWMP